MADPRGYFKLANNFPGHPKVTDAGGDAGWLHVCAMGYCSQLLTDGFIPFNMIGRISDRENPQQLASKLLEVGLWHVTGHTCLRCPEVPPNRYLIHDYLEHQTSAEQAKETSRKRAVAGQRGGVAKAAAAQSAQKQNDVDANDASNLLEAGQAPVSSKSLPEVEVEVEVVKNSSPSAKADEGMAPKRARPKRKTAEGFDDFWKTYPLRVGKQAAEKAYAKAIAAGAKPSDILDGAMLYAIDRKGVDKDHIKYPQGWLNDGRWQDEHDTGQTSLPVPVAAAVPWCGECSNPARQIENHIGALVPCQTCSPHRRTQ